MNNMRITTNGTRWRVEKQYKVWGWRWWTPVKFYSPERPWERPIESFANAATAERAMLDLFRAEAAKAQPWKVVKGADQ